LLALRPHLRQRDLPELVEERAALSRAQARMRGGYRIARVPAVLGQCLRRRYSRFGHGLLGWKRIAADLFLYPPATAASPRPSASLPPPPTRRTRASSTAPSGASRISRRYARVSDTDTMNENT